MDANKSQEICNNSGRPGAAAFRFAVRRARINITELEARAFVAKQATGQLFQGRLPSDGKIPGGGREDMRFQMDLIDLSKRIQKLNGTHKYVLVAVDNYNRQIFTQPIQRKTAQATLDSFRRIIAANANVMPKEITGDLGNEYAMLEPYIESLGGF